MDIFYYLFFEMEGRGIFYWIATVALAAYLFKVSIFSILSYTAIQIPFDIEIFSFLIKFFLTMIAELTCRKN